MCPTESESSSEENDPAAGPPAPKRPAVDNEPIITDSYDDVARFINRPQLSATDRYSIMNNHFRPSPNYQFPKFKGRSFQQRWLENFPWLVYSRQDNGGYCLPCVLFTISGYHGSNPGILVSRPLTAFNKALEEFRKHASKEYHLVALVKAEEFRKTMTNEQPSIQSRLNNALAERVAVNREKLASIMKTVVLCGRQNIALRGHRDNATDLDRDTPASDNHGNFLALLNFRVEAGDTILGNHLSTAARNATYTSNTIQNQIVNVLSDQVRQQIIRNVKEAKWYTVK